MCETSDQICEGQGAGAFEHAYAAACFPCHICKSEGERYVYERSEVCLIDGKITCNNCADDTYPDAPRVSVPSPGSIVGQRTAMLKALQRIEDYALAFPDLGTVSGIAAEAIANAEGGAS